MSNLLCEAGTGNSAEAGIGYIYISIYIYTSHIRYVEDIYFPAIGNVEHSSNSVGASYIYIYIESK